MLTRGLGHGLRAYARARMSTLVVDHPYQTGESVCSLEVLNTGEASKVLKTLVVEQKAWAGIPLVDRIEACKSFMAYLNENSVEVAGNISDQMGKPVAQARNEIRGVMERVEAMIELAPSVLADEVLPEKDGLVRKITREPVGVVLVIAPWNYPLLTAVNAIVPAILAGNSVLVKHSSRTPLCGIDLEKAFSSFAPVRSVITGHASIEHLITCGDVGAVSFTGSVSGGKRIQEIASRVKGRFIETTLELGGKDPAYVSEDANLESAAESIADGGFYNAGQSCCGVERVYVHKSVYEKFLELLLAKTTEMFKIGNPHDPATTMGPMANPGDPANILRQVEDAKKKGGRVLCGGDVAKDSEGLGRFFQPTLVADCDHSMEIMTLESFGPVLGIASVESDEQALEMMNDSRYGLTASIYSTSQDRVERMAPKLQTGTVFMNRCDYLDPFLPWTGVKETGKGVSLSKHGFNAFTKFKGYNFRK